MWGFDEYRLTIADLVQVMVVNCSKTASELAARVASAKRDQAGNLPTTLEEQLEQKEDLLSSIKTAIDAANQLQVVL